MENRENVLPHLQPLVPERAFPLSLFLFSLFSFLFSAISAVSYSGIELRS